MHRNCSASEVVVLHRKGVRAVGARISRWNVNP
jgi:hypothetical protein